MIDTITSTLNQFTGLNVALAMFLPSLFGIAAQFAAMMPPPENPGVYAAIHKVVNVLGRNVKHAENKQ